MLSEPRTISLLCELVHIPAKHPSEALRDVYNRVCNSCGYENFIRTPGGARIERQDPEGGGFSHLHFAGDRIQFTEDHVGISVEQFSRKVAAVLRDAVPLLRIPIILVQQTTVRVTAMPNGFRTAGEFLAQRMFRIEPQDLAGFERPTNLFGFRMMFPPTSDQPHGFNARIETYLRDGRSLYIENIGTTKTPIQSQSVDVVEKSIQLASQFIVERILPFLSRHDTRESDA